jgi:hypothetical protein
MMRDEIAEQSDTKTQHPQKERSRLDRLVYFAVGASVFVCIIYSLQMIVTGTITGEVGSLMNTPRPAVSTTPTPISLDLLSATAVAAQATEMAAYQVIDLRELVSYSDNYRGQKVVVSGRVFNVVTNRQLQLFLDGTRDAVMVNTIDPFSAIYKDDNITVYGTVKQKHCFENVLGGRTCQPLIGDAFFYTNHPSMNIEQGTEDDSQVDHLREAGIEAIESTPASLPEAGFSRHNAAEIGDRLLITLEHISRGKLTIEMALLDVVSGDEAWQMLYQANRFNKEPKSHQEYILAKFWVKIVEAEKEPFSTAHRMFTAVSAQGRVYDEFVSVMSLSPSLSTELFEGAEWEGWTYFLVDKGDNPTLRFTHGNGTLWFALPQ